MAEPGNYFEQLVIDYARSQDEVHRAEEHQAAMERYREEQAAQQAEQQQRVAEEVQKLQGILDAQYAGTDPSLVWGDEAAGLCLEFLAFARGRYETRGRAGVMLPEPVLPLLPPRPSSSRLMRSAHSRQALPAYQFYHSAFGYPVAVSHHEHALKHASPKRVVRNVGDGSPQPATHPVPSPDVYLCEDGLLRRGRGALYVARPDGSVWIPQVGQFAWENVRRIPSERSFSGYPKPGSDVPDRVYIPERIEWGLKFLPAELKDVLGHLALQIGGQ